MQLSRHLTVHGVQSVVYRQVFAYIMKLGYSVVDSRPDYMLVSKKDLFSKDGEKYELWLTVAITGESFVTVFMDYQLRKAGLDENGWTDSQKLLHDIDKEYHTLWSFLSKAA
ncbi:MAG: hypothetical protein QW767_05830 [Thermoprotei archaeon]